MMTTEPTLPPAGGYRPPGILIVILAIVAVFMVFFVANGRLQPPAAAGCIAVTALILYSVARKGATRPPVSDHRRTTGPWPDNGMKSVALALETAAIIVDSTGVIRFLNERAQAEFPVLRTGDPLLAGLRIPDIGDALTALRDGAGRQRVAWTSRVPQERWFEAHLSSIGSASHRDEAGQTTRFVLLTIEDLTERHRLDRMRSDFVANASHELRTPLAALSGFIETLQGPAREDAAARGQFLAIMGDQAGRMRRLIDDLLSLSRVEMKAHQPVETLCDLADVLAHVVAALGPVAAKSQVTLAASGLDQPAGVRGEADELVQVFSNLIENAIKYGGIGKTVDISLARADAADTPGWQVRIRDHGPGIDARHLPRLTERFYRTDVAESRAKQGTGLGLAIVKHILTRHGAQLTIDSRLGDGSTFSVRFRAENLV